jgi:hypothetical protein
MLTGSGGHTPNNFQNYISLSQYPIWYFTPQTIERQFGAANLKVGGIVRLNRRIYRFAGFLS